MHAPLLLSLIRRREGINACISALTGERAIPDIVNRPLEELDNAVYPQRGTLLADWHALGLARDIGAVWPAFWRVFWTTLAEAQEAAPAAMPQRIAPFAKPAATAAHPRAFRGTKFRPPKQPFVALNLHAWMADDRLLDGFFARHDFERWPVIGPNDDIWPTEIFGGGMPTVAGLLHQHGLNEEAALPTAYKRHFQWLLRTKAPALRIEWLRIWRAFGSPGEGDLLAMLARLCALDASAHAWLELALNLTDARQIIFLSCVLRYQAFHLPATLFGGEQLSAFDALSNDDARFDTYIDIALDNLNRGVRIAYTLVGCELSESVGRFDISGADLRTSFHSDEVPVADIERMSTAVGNDRLHWVRTTWHNCATQPGYVRILKETSWESLTSEAADRWLSLFLISAWDVEDPALRASLWRVRLAMFPDLHREMLALPPERRLRFIAMQTDFINSCDDSKSQESSWPALLPLLARLCRPPFPVGPTGNEVLPVMARHLPASGWLKLAELSDSIWLATEQACRRDNDAALIRMGLSGLCEAMPGFALCALIVATKRLMRSMSLIGCLEYNSRRRFLAQACETSWFATQWQGMDQLAACERIFALCTEYALDSPLPRRLREHIAGKVELNQVQLARHCRVTLARLPFVQLAALDAMAWRYIDGPFNLRDHSAAANHAVRLHASIDGGNKKALRRFLLGYASGGVHAYLDHPLNQQWYMRHPRINADIWGSSHVREFTGNGDIRISIETDPLEILMLGSYVGSCLGLGGLCDYSAVACLVDANKQVAYARDKSGRVVARQLLAIDERDRLVCFAIYPLSADAPVLAAFKQFNQSLARALALDIYRDGDADPYEVKIILAMHWWDDGAMQESESNER